VARMSDGSTTPTRAQFEALRATHPVVPLSRKLLADAETALTVYRKLAGGPGTFLLESAEAGRSWSRWSFIGVAASAMLTTDAGVASWVGDAPATTGTDPLDALGQAWRALRSPRLPGLPPLTGGFVGYLAYDLVRCIERLPEHSVDELGVPDLAMLLVTDLAALDHHEGTITLIANIGPDGGYDDAVGRLDRMQEALAGAAPSSVATMQETGEPAFDSRTAAGDYLSGVARALEEIRSGEVFQIQVGQRFRRPTDADALDVYRVLRTTNPSPYMYLLRLQLPDGRLLDVVGSSPEALVTVHDGEAVLHPIAGTRRRGRTDGEDAALAAELMADAKERAEHVMLVDLARNDLGRACAPGSVEVSEFGVIERYSHVMHIVSTVTARVAPGKDALDVLTATFPAGTLTGAPKVRAMELIEELEPVRRGIYGGAVGYLDTHGDLDMAIAIRTAVMIDGVANVQASAGIVADSVPEHEEAETRHKARAVLRAVALAETMRGIHA
jgi:anthranilate synthase component 1